MVFSLCVVKSSGNIFNSEALTAFSFFSFMADFWQTSELFAESVNLNKKRLKRSICIL